MMKNKKRIPLRRQAGNLIITTSIGLGVLAVAQVGSTSYMVKKAKEAQGAIVGTQMANLKGDLGTYIATYFSTLQSATPTVAGVVDPMHPTIAELQALGLPNTSTQLDPTLGGKYLTEITLAPAGCVAPNCNVRGKVWLRDPILDPSGAVDLRLLGSAVQAGNGGMGYSLPASATTVSSAEGWSENNPDAAKRAGILVAVTGYDSSGLAQYIRRDGTQTATANHNWGGHDLTNMGTAQAGTVHSTGQVVADTEIKAGGWLRNTKTNTGWYNEATNGGLYMSDPSWVRSYADKGIYTGGQMQAGSMQSNGSITAAGNVIAYQPSYTVTDNWAFLAYSSGWGGYAAPQSYIGSAYLNDAYFRSTGKWASQMGGVNNSYVASSGGWATAGYAACPAGTKLTGGSCDMYRGGDGREIGPRSCEPNGNGYYCAEGNSGYCIAFAVCVN